METTRKRPAWKEGPRNRRRGEKQTPPREDLFDRRQRDPRLGQVLDDIIEHDRVELRAGQLGVRKRAAERVEPGALATLDRSRVDVDPARLPTALHREPE